MRDPCYSYVFLIEKDGFVVSLMEKSLIPVCFWCAGYLTDDHSASVRIIKSCYYNVVGIGLLVLFSYHLVLMVV